MAGAALRRRPAFPDLSDRRVRAARYGLLRDNDSSSGAYAQATFYPPDRGPDDRRAKQPSPDALRAAVPRSGCEYRRRRAQKGTHQSRTARTETAPPSANSGSRANAAALLDAGLPYIRRWDACLLERLLGDALPGGVLAGVADEVAPQI